jgi:hypothetical protein
VRPPARHRLDRGESGLRARRDAIEVFAMSRLLVLAVATVAALKANLAHSEFDVPAVSQPFGGWPLDGLFTVLFSTLAQFDAVYYLTIARDGYDAAGPQGPAFFPLYPLATRVVSGWGATPETVLIAAYVVSLASFAGALYLLHRLVELEIGRELARPVLLLVAFFPTAVFFSAPYTESLFLLLSVGAVYAARRGRWAWAGGLAALASATRVPGVALLVPLALLYLYGPRADAAPEVERRRRAWTPRYRPRPDLLWLALVPVGLLAYAGYLELSGDDALAFLHAQEGAAGRDFDFPLAAVWDGVHAAGAGVRAVAEGAAETAPAGHNLVNLAFLAFAAIATVGAFRRLPVAYGAYVVAALLPPLSSPYPGEPLLSLPRFVAVLFPLFMWLAMACEERRLTDRALIASAILLGLFTAEFAVGVWAA